MIETVFEDHIELTRAISQLHMESKKFHLDPVFGKGLIHAGLGRPYLTFDIEPQDPFVKKHDCRSLPLISGSIESIMFDPPFLAGGGPTGRMHNNYSSLRSWRELFEFYYDSLVELERVLAKNGIIVFKCQDLMNGRSQYFSHCEIYRMAISLGLYAKDLFILKSSRLMKPPNMEKQLHARKAHTYFWVFKKCKRTNGVWAPGPQ